MKKNYLNRILLGFVFVLWSPTLVAVEIDYDEYGRPVYFQELIIDSSSYYVRVSYDSSMAMVWGLPEGNIPPKFMGDQDGAVEAMTAILEALQEDGFTYDSLLRTATLWIPYELFVSSPDYYRGVFARLALETPVIETSGSAYYNQIYNNDTGFVSFGVFSNSFESPASVQE